MSTLFAISLPGEGVIVLFAPASADKSQRRIGMTVEAAEKLLAELPSLIQMARAPKPAPTFQIHEVEHDPRNRLN